MVAAHNTFVDFAIGKPSYHLVEQTVPIASASAIKELRRNHWFAATLLSAADGGFKSKWAPRCGSGLWNPTSDEAPLVFLDPLKFLELYWINTPGQKLANLPLQTYALPSPLPFVELIDSTCAAAIEVVIHLSAADHSAEVAMPGVHPLARFVGEHIFQQHAESTTAVHVGSAVTFTVPFLFSASGICVVSADVVNQHKSHVRVYKHTIALVQPSSQPIQPTAINPLHFADLAMLTYAAMWQFQLPVTGVHVHAKVINKLAIDDMSVQTITSACTQPADALHLLQTCLIYMWLSDAGDVQYFGDDVVKLKFDFQIVFAIAACEMQQQFVIWTSGSQSAYYVATMCLNRPIDTSPLTGPHVLWSARELLDLQWLDNLTMLTDMVSIPVDSLVNIVLFPYKVHIRHLPLVPLPISASQEQQRQQQPTCAVETTYGVMCDNFPALVATAVRAALKMTFLKDGQATIWSEEMHILTTTHIQPVPPHIPDRWVLTSGLGGVTPCTAFARFFVSSADAQSNSCTSPFAQRAAAAYWQKECRPNRKVYAALEALQKCNWAIAPPPLFPHLHVLF